jgi:hypothetical protein
MKSKIKIFISWSGDFSHNIAQELCNWLPIVVERVNFWISSRDIPEGKRWTNEIGKALEEMDFGIIIVTPDNQNAPWLLFEAGALSKNIAQGRVIPYIVSTSNSEFNGPLSQFQAVKSK